MSYLNSSPSASLQILALALPLLVGCGGSAPAPPATVFPNVTGNWQFEVGNAGPGIPVLIGSPIADLSGSLSSTDGKVTGTLTSLSISITPCISSNTDIQVSGTIDSAGNLSLTAPIAGGVATITALVTTNPTPIFEGTYQVIGGPCAQTSVPLAAMEVPNISGTYAGTLTQVAPQGTGSLTVKATLMESATPNVDGKYPLSGSVTYSGDCSGTLSLNNYLVFGVNIEGVPSLSGQIFSGAVALGPTKPLLAFITEPTGCPGIVYNGNLTLQ
ncbi:MAG TPA: hypothetical protein VFC39_10750 [Acidobacteriaceae bacterium]|nr:hypothetical protein [Acidobacteriaceae bacterium]